MEDFKKYCSNLWTNFSKKIQILFISSSISLIILIVFFTLQYNECKILTLDNKWIAISIIPIIIGLFLSEIIKSVKGFGIELEANLSKKIDFSLLKNIEPSLKPKQGKESEEELNNLSNSKKKKIKILQFVECKKRYYAIDVIIKYFEELKNIQYIEIVNENDEFIALLHKSQIYKENNNNNRELIEIFKQNLENCNIINHYKDCITTTIQEDDELLVIYEKFKTSKKSHDIIRHILPVVDKHNKLIGTILRCNITEKISEYILNMKSKT
jgi:hypothetical protein